MTSRAYTVRQVTTWFEQNRYVALHRAIKENWRRYRYVRTWCSWGKDNEHREVRELPLAANHAYGRVLRDLLYRWPGADTSHYNLPFEVNLGAPFANPARFTATLLARFCFGDGAYFTLEPLNVEARRVLEALGVRERWRYAQVSCPDSMTYSPAGLLAYLSGRLTEGLFPEGHHRLLQVALGLTKPEYLRQMKLNLNRTNTRLDYRHPNPYENELPACRKLRRRLKRRCNIEVEEYALEPNRRIARLLGQPYSPTPLTAQPYPDIWRELEDFDGDIEQAALEVTALLQPGPTVIYY